MAEIEKGKKWDFKKQAMIARRHIVIPQDRRGVWRGHDRRPQVQDDSDPGGQQDDDHPEGHQGWRQGRRRGKGGGHREGAEQERKWKKKDDTDIKLELTQHYCWDIKVLLFSSIVFLFSFFLS